MADADSLTTRKRAWDWWTSVLQTRLEPVGAICLIQTRWHEDDLAGRILATERDAWRVIDLPAIADSPDDPLGRTPGQALWPQRYDVTHHAKTRKRVGERVWAALYLQKPRTEASGGRSGLRPPASTPSSSPASTWRASSSQSTPPAESPPSALW
jgi:hypothetical protein